MAKTGRRGFFGKAFGGFLAAVGLGKVAPRVINWYPDSLGQPEVSNGSTGRYIDVTYWPEPRA